MAKHNSTQLEAQQSDLNQGIEISSLNGRDFQPSGISISYDSARAAITGKYEYHANDFITFKLIGAASFDGKDPAFTTTTRPVTKDGFADVTFYGMSANPVVHVVLVASLSSDPEVSGTRDFTFMAYPIAAPDQLGCVTVGSGLAITPEGKLSVSAAGGTPYSLPIATAALLGGVKQGTNVSIANDGKLSVAAATTAVAGVVPLASAAEVKAGQDVSKAVTAKDISAVYAPLASPRLSGCATIVDPNSQSGAKLIVAKSLGDAGGPAPHSLDYRSIYLQVGGSEFGSASYRMIGFGCNSSEMNTPPVAIGSIEASSSSEADFIVATRSGASLTSPVERLRVGADGRVTITNDQTKIPPAYQELVTKAYVAGIVANTSGVRLATPEQTRTGTDNTTAVTPMDVKTVYAPLVSPKFFGVVTLDHDQTDSGYQVADQELVTKKLLSQSTQGVVTIDVSKMGWGKNGGGGGIDMTNAYTSCPIIRFIGELKGIFWVRMRAVGQWTIINDCTGKQVINIQHSASANQSIPVYESQRADIVVVSRGGQLFNTYLAAPPVLNPAFTGAATITNDQTVTDYKVADQELITSKYLNVQKSPKFYLMGQLKAGEVFFINLPFVNGSTWLLSPVAQPDTSLNIGPSTRMELKDGDWFNIKNASRHESIAVHFSGESFFWNGLAFNYLNTIYVLPGQSCQVFWSDSGLTAAPFWIASSQASADPSFI
ncbi:hypothetical protein PS870_06383 [Pseudomonas fluorescens]|uniref:Uncharacterized protein n=1 Tax=Pseudomonas fluorescens TaxID=294 RepID=A0A5E7QL73_PSEFL|nr:hypothetical protein [Pseudomonas fluorescens]VVP61617.1 hypothetical protein PS870_06383 [Pseudomonas fluorescens]